MTTTTYLEWDDQATGSNNNTWGDVTDANLTILEQAIARYTSISTTGGTTTLTSSQNRYPIIKITGALVGVATIVVRTAEKNWIFINATTGNFSVTVKTLAGTGKTLPKNRAVKLYCDGTNVEHARYMNIPTATAGGTADALTGTFEPATTSAELVDGTIFIVGATAANTTTAPTFNPDGLGAAVIRKLGGQALVAGDIRGNGHKLLLCYNGAAYELLNPTSPLGMTIDNSGNVGIGMTPTYKLDISGGMRLTESVTMSTSTFVYSYAGGSVGQVRAGINYDGTNQLLAMYTGQNERLRIDSSGNVGIGRTAAYTLDVYRSGSSAANISAANDSVVNSLYVGSTAAGLGTLTSHDLIFVTGNTERARIDTGGNLLVGTNIASASSGIGVKTVYNATTPYHAVVGSSSTDPFTAYHVYSTGFGGYRFYVGYGGTVFATNTTISSASDVRLKENIRPLDVGLAEINRLQPRKFDWKEGKGKGIKDDRGWIAQEFEQVFPDLIDEWKDPPPEGEAPYKSVRADLIPVLVKAVQELSAKNDALEARIAALESA